MTMIPSNPPPIRHRSLKQGPLASSQESLWFLQQLDPDNNAYNSDLILKFTGGIDRQILEQALNELVRRHEPLRTLYPNHGGRPIQVIQPCESLSLPFVDLSGLPADQQEHAIRRYETEQGNLPFDLLHGPMVRCALFHSDPKVDYLFFSTHHIGFDAWSREIFFSELMKLYDAFRSGKEPVLPELPIQYVDYATWQREWLSGETLSTYIEHWKKILSGDLPILELPTDRSRPVMQSYRGARYHFLISPAFSSQIKAFCQREHITSFQLLLSAYTLLLMRYTGQEDIIIGCPFANRSRSELDGMLGLFVNTLPIRIKAQGNPSVREFLSQIRTVMVEAYPWQAAPFEALVSELSPERDLSRTPIFQVLINLRNVPRHRASLEGLEMELILRENAPSPFDLSLEFDTIEDGSLDASLQYNIDLFDESTIIRMATHYQRLLGELLNKADSLISDLEMLTSSEKQKILVEWNDTVADFPRDKCIQQLFEEQVERTPDFPAVIFGEQQLTYRELNQRANRIAHYLRRLEASPDVPVGLYLERSAELVVAILGILKAGCPYVPLDTLYPKERREEIIRDSGMKILVTQNVLVTDEFADDLTLLCLDRNQELLDAQSSQNPIQVGNPDNLVYIIYTSGSTGKPKGVEITHRSLVNCLCSANERVGLSAGNLSLTVFTPTFDVSVFDLLSPLILGATVAVASREEVYDSALLAKRIMELPLTWMSASPTTWRMLLDAGWQGKAGLKILCTGEAFPADLANRLTQMSGEVYNLYGPTEATIWCASARLTHGQPMTIGRPMANTSLYILDSHHMPVPVGVVGELYIGGDGLARGYHNRPELTAEKFIPKPFKDELGGRLYATGDLARFRLNGEIDVLGRTDFQVKIHGYRIELGEIETVLGEHPEVQQATAVVREDQPGDKRLVVYIVTTSGEVLIESELRSYLREKLPVYMVPSTFVQMDAFPLNVSGKVDRRALPRPEARAATDHYLAPRNEMEKRMISIWKEVLGIEQIGVRDNFFELGGDSLLAVRLFTRIQEEFGESLPLLMLFKDGTVEALVESFTGENNLRHPSGIISIRPEGSEQPLFFISPDLYLRELALALAPGWPVYGVDPVDNGNVIFRKSVQETARIYYHNLVDFYPQGSLLLLAHSANGLFALELARLLVKNGKNVAFLGLLDTYPPGPTRQAKLTDRVKIHLINLQDKNIPEILKYVQHSVTRFLNRRRRRAVIDANMIERYEHKGQFNEVRNLILRAYKPEPYGEKVYLFSAIHRPWYMNWDPMKQWSNIVTGQLDIVPVTGDHMSMVKPPHVADLARKIEALLPRNEII
jgi:amino acid adenylation domain-containing protein